jgi:predicted AlkP superfamily pyrophosphatase or phosphodiesterase
MTMAKNKDKSVALTLVLTLLFLTVSPLLSEAHQQRSAQPSSGQRNTSPQPKLVVIIMIDQCRYDFLERFQENFGEKGFRRLVNGGASFTNANYDYVPTVTAAGHAAVHTGSNPANNGIIGNYRVELDQESRLARKINGAPPGIVYDEGTYPVTSAGVVVSEHSASPKMLVCETIGNRLKGAKLQSKVVSMAGKDRSAILPGGKISPDSERPNGVYWYTKKGDSGEFVTSTCYFGNAPLELPKWVRDFDKNTNPTKYFGKWKWERYRDAKKYHAMSRHLGEQNKERLCRTTCDFPYDVDKDNFEYTPFASDYLEEFAEAAITGESLGKDDAPDLLAISLSQPDLLGHAFGPDSQEIEDTYIRLDATLGRFLDFIDDNVGDHHNGLKETIIALTSDHGVVSIPQHNIEMGRDAGVVDKKKLMHAVDDGLKNQFFKEDRSKMPDEWVLDIANEQLYLNPVLLKRLEETGKAPSQAEATAKEIVKNMPGIASVFTRTDIEGLEKKTPLTALEQLVKKGYYIGADGKGTRRNGDLWIITKENWFISEDVATTHGSPYQYDTHVPLILYGARVKPGSYENACSPSDIAPTLAKMLGIGKPSKSVGRELVEALVRP